MVQLTRIILAVLAVASACSAVPIAALPRSDDLHVEEDLDFGKRWASCLHLSPLASQSDNTDVLHRSLKDYYDPYCSKPSC
jgi:hypothetical protein